MHKVKYRSLLEHNLEVSTIKIALKLGMQEQPQYELVIGVCPHLDRDGDGTGCE